MGGIVGHIDCRCEGDKPTGFSIENGCAHLDVNPNLRLDLVALSGWSKICWLARYE